MWLLGLSEWVWTSLPSGRALNRRFCSGFMGMQAITWKSKRSADSFCIFSAARRTFSHKSWIPCESPLPLQIVGRWLAQNQPLSYICDSGNERILTLWEPSKSYVYVLSYLTNTSKGIVACMFECYTDIKTRKEQVSGLRDEMRRNRKMGIQRAIRCSYARMMYTTGARSSWRVAAGVKICLQ